MPDAYDPVRSVATFDVVSATTHHTVRDLAQLMAENNCGAVVVTMRDGQVAIVTERDIVMCLASGQDSDDAWAVDAMSHPVLVVDPDDDIIDAAELMIEGGVRHLIVEDTENERIGVVSVRDLLEPLVESIDDVDLEDDDEESEVDGEE